MKPYAEMSVEELQAELAEVKALYRKYQDMDLHLDMRRGVPCTEQLDLSMGMMDALDSTQDLRCDDGTDCRTYGVLGGIHEAKELIGDMMENPERDVRCRSPRDDPRHHGQYALVQA